MAGKFVTIDEAARILGVSIDEVNRLVDRKKLFPLRDGSAIKFKAEQIERVAAALADEGAVSEPPALDLDAAESDDLALGDAIEIDDLAVGDEVEAGSQTIVRDGASASINVSRLALGDDDALATEGDDLALESIIGASSPSLAPPAPRPGSLVGSAPQAGEPLTLDLSAIAADGSGAPPVQPGSRLTGGGGSAAGSAPGSNFAAPLDSGLSLEDGGIAVSGIDLDAGPSPGSGVSAASGSLAGEAFELGADMGDEESASVVIATEESGDSSFFANAVDDSASVQFGDSSVVDSASSSLLNESLLAPTVEMGFSGWQIAGLTCCALVLLAGAFVMYDLAWTIRTPQGSPLSAPLLNALSDAFGWRG